MNSRIDGSRGRRVLLEGQGRSPTFGSEQRTCCLSGKRFHKVTSLTQYSDVYLSSPPNGMPENRAQVCVTWRFLAPDPKSGSEHFTTQLTRWISTVTALSVSILGIDIRVRYLPQACIIKPVDNPPPTVAVSKEETLRRTGCMVDLRIRRLDDWVAEALRARAKRNGHSLEEELREALRHDVKREKEQLVAEHMEMLKTLRDKYGTFSDSTLLIREDRDARG